MLPTAKVNYKMSLLLWNCVYMTMVSVVIDGGAGLVLAQIH